MLQLCCNFENEIHTFAFDLVLENVATKIFIDTRENKIYHFRYLNLEKVDSTLIYHFDKVLDYIRLLYVPCIMLHEIGKNPNGVPLEDFLAELLNCPELMKEKSLPIVLNFIGAYCALDEEIQFIKLEIQAYQRSNKSIIVNKDDIISVLHSCIHSATMF